MKHDFSNLSLRGLKKAGDIVLPGGDGFPKFSETNLLEHFGRISNYMTPQDRQGFKLLTALMGLMPSFMIHLMLIMVSHHDSVPSFLGAIFRQVNMGVKGVLFTMYYSGLDETNQERSKIFKLMNYHSTINSPVTEDIEMETLVAQNNPLKPVPTSGPVDAAAVFAKARVASVEIASLSVKERLTFITKLRETILRRQEEITDIIQKETSKSRTDILTSEFFPLYEHLEFLEHQAVAALEAEKVATPIAMMGKSSKVWFEPLGTILIISPWNYPFYQAIVPITCSFITGNASIYKPSELTPLKGLV